MSAIHELHEYYQGMLDQKNEEIDALRAENEELRADNEWLRKVMQNAIAAQDFNEARRALEQARKE